MGVKLTEMNVVVLVWLSISNVIVIFHVFPVAGQLLLKGKLQISPLTMVNTVTKRLTVD